jgi:hypothetical protein
LKRANLDAEARRGRGLQRRKRRSHALFCISLCVPLPLCTSASKGRLFKQFLIAHYYALDTTTAPVRLHAATTGPTTQLCRHR